MHHQKRGVSYRAWRSANSIRIRCACCHATNHVCDIGSTAHC
ncbi:hypothetical protein [Neptunomonas sp.]